MLRPIRLWVSCAGLVIASACGVDTKYGGNEVSSSLIEAQRTGAWVQSLRPDHAGWAVGDTVVGRLQEAWLERQWTHARGEETPHVVPGLQLVLVLQAGQELPARYQARLRPGPALWRANHQLYLPLPDTVRRARYVVGVQRGSTASPAACLDSITLHPQRI